MRTVTAGTRIGEYVLVEPIGSGTFADVWLAHHNVWTDRQVAVKLAREEEYVRYLRREGIILHELDHEYILKTIGLDPEHDPPYIIAEYIAGGSLRELLEKKGKLAPYHALQIIDEMLQGLVFAHEKGVIHRDLKPENVLLQDGSVRLSDFGLGHVTSSLALSSVFLSQAGQAGTPLYFSPEQKLGGELDARSDLYAVGVIFFECLTGSLPAGLEAPSELVATLPDGFDELFRKLYARKENRFPASQAALEVVEDLWRRFGRPIRTRGRTGEAVPRNVSGAPGRDRERPATGAGARTEKPPAPEPPDGTSAGESRSAPERAGREEEDDDLFPFPARPVGLPMRLIAHVLDAMVLVTLLALAVGSLRFGRGVRGMIAMAGIIHLVYTMVMVAFWGGTAGKLLLGMRIGAADGRRANFFQAFLRTIIAFSTAGVGLLVVPFNRYGRALHDYLTNTLVFYR